MANEAKEKTALTTSVDADERQSFPLSYDNSITTTDSEINDQIEKSEETLEEMYRRIQRMNDPAYLPTVTMQEL